MTPYQIKKSILLCHVEKYQANDVIIEQDALDNEMYLLLSGSVKVVFKNEKGEATELATFSPGDVFGEVAFVKQIKRTASVTATSDTELMLFNHRQLNDNMRFYPHIKSKLLLNISKIISEKLVETTKMLAQKNA